MTSFVVFIRKSSGGDESDGDSVTSVDDSGGKVFKWVFPSKSREHSTATKMSGNGEKSGMKSPTSFGAVYGSMEPSSPPPCVTKSKV